MALLKETLLTIKNNKSVKLSSQLKFFKNDSLILDFIIEQYNFEIKEYQRIVPLSAIMYIETPEGIDSVEAVQLEDKKVTFKLTPKYTQFVGIFKMQIVIRDAMTEDGICCQCAIPPFEFEVQELINDAEVLIDTDGNIIITEKNEPLVITNDGYTYLSEIEETDTIDEGTSLLVQKDGSVYKSSCDKFVKFVAITSLEYGELEVKDSSTIYFITDEGKVYLGDVQLNS